MPKEAQLYDELRRAVSWPWVERVENRVNLGTPDVHFRSPNQAGWIELKRELVLRPELCVALRKEQVVWALAYSLAGGSSWIILQAGSQYFCWAGGRAREVKALPLAESSEYCLFYGSKIEFYQRLRSFFG